MLIEQIQMLQKQRDLLKKDIANIMEQVNSPICSIPGIGTWLGAIIISEIGDITRFKSATKLLAYAGLDPSVRQSGNFNATNTKMSKRGSPYLRRTFWLAAISGIRFNPAFRAVYDKKRAQGKAHAVAVSVVMRKLCNIVFAILKTNTPYKVILPD